MTTVAQFAAIRHVRGDEYTEALLDRLVANGLRVYASNLYTRSAVVEEPLAAALAHSSNVHVFQLEGSPVGVCRLSRPAVGDRRVVGRRRARAVDEVEAGRARVGGVDGSGLRRQAEVLAARCDELRVGAEARGLEAGGCR